MGPNVPMNGRLCSLPNGHPRSRANIDMFLPKRPFIIALRPFGAPSFLADKFQSTTQIESLQDIKELLKWKMMQVK